MIGKSWEEIISRQRKSCRRVSVMSNATMNVKGKTTIALTLLDT